MTDALGQLPPFQWRGRYYPVTSRRMNFSHENVQHKLQYRDGEIVEQTGARNPTFSYSVPMRQDIAKGPYRDLFTSELRVLFRDMYRREPGELVDPYYGVFTVVPTSFEDELEATKRDGADVRIEFLLSPEIGAADQLAPPTLQGIATEAGAFDQEIQRANWQQEPPPPATTDALSAVNGILFTGQRAINKVSAAANDLAFRLEKIETTIDRTTDPKNWPFRRDSRRLREATIQAGKYQDPSRTIVPVVIGFTKTISAVAADLGITVEALLASNPVLARNPFVPKGTKVRVPRAA